MCGSSVSALGQAVSELLGISSCRSFCAEHTFTPPHIRICRLHPPSITTEVKPQGTIFTLIQILSVSAHTLIRV